MLHAYALKQRDEQAVEYRLEAIAFEQTCLVAVAARLSAAAEDITLQKSKSASFAASFDHYYALLSHVEV